MPSGVLAPFAFVVVICNQLEVHFTPEQEAKIAEIANSKGTDPENLVKDLLSRCLDEEEQFLTAIERGLAAAERGEFVEESEMDARVERMFRKS